MTIPLQGEELGNPGSQRGKPKIEVIGGGGESFGGAVHGAAYNQRMNTDVWNQRMCVKKARRVCVCVCLCEVGVREVGGVQNRV